MTNKEYMTTLPSEEIYELLDWLINVYSRGFTNSRQAIIEWLDEERRTE